MEIVDLISIMNEVLCPGQTASLNYDSHYKECESWSSLNAFMITGLLYDRYHKKVRGSVFGKSETIAELFVLIK